MTEILRLYTKAKSTFIDHKISSLNMKYRYGFPNVCDTNINNKKAGEAILTSDNIHFRTSDITRNKERHFKIKG